MSTRAFDINLGTFKEFGSYVKRFGFSITNFYDVHFDMTNRQGNLNNIFKRIPGTNSITLNDADRFNMKGLMRFYAEECTIPGFQISTGEYRITNTPQLKYAYGIVNNEINFSFIGDANAEIRKTFDAWQSYIYAHNLPGRTSTNAGILNINRQENLGRTRYRDEYVSDIVIVKFERAGISDSTSKPLPLPGGLQAGQYMTAREIIPDYTQSTLDKELVTKFERARPLYSVRLINAFPTNVSSIPLSSGASELVKVQVTFEYETAVTSAHNNGTVQGSIKTIV
jgi:hypothetical protein